MKRILFLTSNSLTTNPRLVKELSLACQGNTCGVISFQFHNWSDSLDQHIRDTFKDVSFRTISFGRNSLYKWLLNSLIEKVCKVIYPIFKDVATINAYGHSKRSLLLTAELKKLKDSYDIVIAHNLAALYPAYLFAKQQNIPFAFDVEDYHPGEIVGDDCRNEVLRRRFLLRKLLPTAKYISYASNSIGFHTLADLHQNPIKNHFLIPNCFPKSEFISPLTLEQSDKLRLVWFSQYITSNRGLEELIEAIKAFKGQIELHLIGTLKVHFKPEIEKHKDFIFTYKAMKQVDLHRFISKFDVGLALEMSSVDLNKDIAVSNKIYAYAQAGLYILATNTKGQSWFIKKYPWSGEVVGQSTSLLVSALADMFRIRVAIRSGATYRYEKALSLSWEKESQKLVEAWK